MNEVPKYIHDIIKSNVALAESDTADTYILFCNKHLKSDVLKNKYEKLCKWLMRHGATFPNYPYDWDQEKIIDRYKIYEFRMWFGAYSNLKQLFGFLKYFSEINQ